MQEELKEFDESNMLLMQRLTEVVNERKELEAKQVEQAAKESQRNKASARPTTRASQVSRSIHNSDLRVGTANNSIEGSVSQLRESEDQSQIEQGMGLFAMMSAVNAGDRKQGEKSRIIGGDHM